MRLSLLENGAFYFKPLTAIRGRRLFPSPPIHARWLSNADIREGVEQSKYVKEPEHYANNDDGVQDRLDAACHGDKAIHKPQEDAHNDQGYKNLNERHSFLPFCPCCETLSRRSQELLFALPSDGNALNQFHSTNCRTARCPGSANDVLYDVLSFLGVEVSKLKRVNWPTLQSFYYKTILGVAEEHVCSLVYKSEV
jgi:hypothetical protein